MEYDIAIIHLVEGPVGAGKSTFSARLSLTHQAPHIDLDEWMVTLFSPDRPEDEFVAWYAERKNRCIEQIWRIACEVLECGSAVVLELGLVQVAERESFYRRVDGTGYELQVYLLDTPMEERRRRVVERNEQRSSTYKMEVTDEVFDLANSFWQEPDEEEIRARDMHIVPAS